MVVSTAFLVSYLTYHYHVGDVRFQGHGIVRPIYFTILITHIILATAIVPLVLTTLWRALRGNSASIPCTVRVRVSSSQVAPSILSTARPLRFTVKYIKLVLT